MKPVLNTAFGAALALSAACLLSAGYPAAAQAPAWPSPGTPQPASAASGAPSSSGWAAPTATPAATPPTGGFSAPASGWNNPAGAAGPRPGGRDCMGEFTSLRDEAQKKGSAIRAVTERKAPQPEVCAAFKNFATAEAKVVKFIQDNTVECRVPPDALKTVKANHSKTIALRDRVCSAQPTAAAPRPPSLSDALGTSRLPPAPSSAGDGEKKKGLGTFDTLSGSALNR